jgi:hypothetical protein
MARDAYGRSFNQYGRMEFPAPRARQSDAELEASKKRQQEYWSWVDACMKDGFKGTLADWREQHGSRV